MADFDILVVGSGPSGCQAALQAAKRGAKVALVDIGHTDEKVGPSIPDKSFSELRQFDTHQADYFLGSNPELIFDKKLSSHWKPTLCSAQFKGIALGRKTSILT